MKKLLLKIFIFRYAISLFSASLVLAFFAVTLHTMAATGGDNWYTYTGPSAVYRFTLKFPEDWQVYTVDDNQQGFAPKSFEDEDYPVAVWEFEGQSYAQIINYFLLPDEAFQTEDHIVTAAGEDLLAKTITYTGTKSDSKRQVRLFRRGGIVVALTGNGEFTEIGDTIIDSFGFNDEWHQYIDYGEQYAFIFPASFELKITNEGAEIVDDAPFFTIQKYSGVSPDKAAVTALDVGQQYLSSEKIIFHGYDKATDARYRDKGSDKTYSRIFLEKNGHSYGMTNINIEENFPHSDYYDQYVLEILESFEFFDIPNIEDLVYQHFSDVPDKNPNATSINTLFKNQIINGYGDGTFRPDGEINRAELIKMVVASKLEPDPDKYNNCFSDVKKEWHAPYVCYAAEQGWVEGYSDGNFKPAKNTNRVEALKIVMEVMFEAIPESEPVDAMPDDLNLEDWYGGYFTYAWNNDLLDLQHVSGNNYLPGGNISRKEVAETIYRAMK